MRVLSLHLIGFICIVDNNTQDFNLSHRAESTTSTKVFVGTRLLKQRVHDGAFSFQKKDFQKNDIVAVKINNSVKTSLGGETQKIFQILVEFFTFGIIKFTEEYSLQKIIGIPGDVIEYTLRQVISVNGLSYSDTPDSPFPYIDSVNRVTLKKGEYFLVNNDGMNSYHNMNYEGIYYADSSPTHKKTIKGKVLFIMDSIWKWKL